MNSAHGLDLTGKHSGIAGIRWSTEVVCPHSPFRMDAFAAVAPTIHRRMLDVVHCLVLVSAGPVHMIPS